MFLDFPALQSLNLGGTKITDAGVSASGGTDPTFNRWTCIMPVSLTLAWSTLRRYPSSKHWSCEEPISPDAGLRHLTKLSELRVL